MLAIKVEDLIILDVHECRYELRRDLGNDSR